MARSANRPGQLGSGGHPTLVSARAALLQSPRADEVTSPHVAPRTGGSSGPLCRPVGAEVSNEGASVSPRFVAFAWRYLACAASSLSPTSDAPPASLGFDLRSPDRLSREEALRSPRFLGEPLCVHALLFDPDGISEPGHPAPRCCLPNGQRRRLPQRSNSRGSIPRPARSLCTLRSEDRSSTPQHSVPAGGPPLPGGVGYPLGSPRRVSAVIHPAWRPPFPGFSWRNDRM